MEKIIDYVNETPYNTNIGILKEKLKQYGRGLTDGMVKTVNGVAPDENGNVEIKTSGGSMPMFVHFKPTDDSYEVNHTYDEIVNVIEACGSVVATMSMYGSVVEKSYKIEMPDDGNKINFRFNSGYISLKSDNTIKWVGEQ